MRGHRPLLAGVGVALCATAGVSAWLVIRDARVALTRQVQSAEALAATERASALGEAIAGARQRLEVLVDAPGLGAAIAAGESPDGSALTALLPIPAVKGVGIASIDGDLLVSAGTPPIVPSSDAPAFRVTGSRTRAYVTVRATIRHDGGVVGWAVEELDVAEVSPQFTQPFDDFGGRTRLVRRTGEIVLTEEPTTLSHVSAPELAAILAEGVVGVAEYHSDELDTGRIAAVAPVSGTDLMVVVGADAAAADRPAAALARRLLAVFVVTMTIAGALIGCALASVRRMRHGLEQAHSRADALAHTDPLTGLANRRAFDARLAAVRGSVGLVLLDLDHLKSVNDTLGHAAGDVAIQSAAAAIASIVRPTDLAARIGGDEFALVLDDADIAHTTGVAMRARAAVAAAPSPGFVPLSVSTGVACGDGDDPSALLATADASLYIAKAERGVNA